MEFHLALLRSDGKDAARFVHFGHPGGKGEGDALNGRLAGSVLELSEDEPGFLARADHFRWKFWRRVEVGDRELIEERLIGEGALIALPSEVLARCGVRNDQVARVQSLLRPAR